MVCDLIVFLNALLQGGLTPRFLWKVLTVLIICGGIFAYYLNSLRWDRKDEFRQAKKRSLLLGLGSLAVLAIAFCFGLGLAGTPSIQRRKEADKRRVDDLRRLAWNVYSWHQRSSNLQPTAVLPLRLADAVGTDNNRIVDPETKREYEHIPGVNEKYQLCAVFAGSNAHELPAPLFWRHEAGRTCFTLYAAQSPSK